MKAILFSGLLAMLVPSAAFGQEPSKNATSDTAKLQVTQCALKVSGMTCGGCASIVEKGLLKVEGVKTAKVDFKTAQVQLAYDPKITNPEKIVSTFNQAKSGFHAEQTKANTK
jgi:copper chaperone CopZ